MEISRIQELEERFDYLRKSKGNQSIFQVSVGEYIDLLSSSEELAPIVRELALKGKIPVNLLQFMFDSFMIPSAMNLFETALPQYPPFWDNLVEEKFGLSKKFQEKFLKIQSGINTKPVSHKKQTDSFSKKDYKALEKIHESILDQVIALAKQPINIRKKRIKTVKFNSKKLKIVINGQVEVDVQKLTTGSLLCEYMFSSKIKCNEPIDWSIIYEKVVGQEVDITDKGRNLREKRKLRDAMNAVNKKVCNEFGTEANIFRWKENQIKRLY